ncbi:MAG TPA: ABC transporter permease [Microlunatus sp.]|nr:ABC transporter permease [Microlunatus sp.]
MSGLAGTGQLMRLDLRRDRILLPVCIAAFAGTPALSAGAVLGLYPSTESLVQAASLINTTPGLIAFYGRIFDPTSLGAVSMFKLTGLGTVLVALFAVLLVIRHTRADEELGRTELVSSGAIGRYAPLAAAVAVTGSAALLIGLLTGLGLVASGLPVDGSFAFGATWAAAGLAFTGVGAVVSQLTTSARAARGLGVLVLGVAFVLRAVGDTAGVEPGVATWLSPIGWAQQVRPYAGNRWWLLLLPIALGVLLTGFAAVLVSRRDLGAGLIPARPGHARARRWLNSELALTWRLQRAALTGWLVGFAVLGLVMGQIVTNIGDLLNTPVARQIVVALGGTEQLTDAFVDVALTMMAVIASGYGISAALRLSQEETSARGELVLGAPVGRLRWVGAHLLLAALGTAALILVAGLALGLAHAGQVQTATADVLSRDLLAALARVPAAWVLVGFTVALYGVSRRAAPFAWGALVATFLIAELGPTLDLPDWVQKLSPYTHVPQVGATDVGAGTLLALLAIGAGFAAIGLIAIRRRDLAVG